MSVRTRAGTLNGNSIFLARWKDRPYVRLYSEILPDRVDIPGASGKIEGDPTIRSWIINDWSGGQGEPIWREGLASYRSSGGLRPALDGRGLILGAEVVQETDDSFAIGVYASTAMIFDTATDDLYTWNGATKSWDARLTTPVGTGTFTSVATVDDGETYMTTSTGQIHKLVSGLTRSVHYAAGTFTNPILATFRGAVYVLDDDGLYLLDRTTTDTREQVVDLLTTDLMNGGSLRITKTDVGVMWLSSEHDGSTHLHEYNAFLDAHSIVGVLPSRFARSSACLHFARGFAWVLYEEETNGESFLWFKGGGQEGVVRITEGAAGSIAGFEGDDLLMAVGNYLYAYNVSTGAVYRGTRNTVNGISGGLTVGTGTFFAATVATHYVSWKDSDLIAAFHTLDTGRFDFDYPGFDKIFTEVIVYTDEGDGWDGLLGLEYSVDGDTFTAHADTKTISSANRKHTFAISTSESTVKGHDLELRLKMRSDGTDSPVIRKVVARALPAEFHTEFLLELDVAGPTGDGEQIASSVAIEQLRTLAESGDLVPFVNPWEDEDDEDGDSYTVKVVEVAVPHEGPEALEQGVANVRLRVVTEGVAVAQS